jgi:AraC-like DNA-binding protein
MQRRIEAATESRKYAQNGDFEIERRLNRTRASTLVHMQAADSQQIRILSDSKLKRIIDYIRDNLHRNLKLPELSALVKLTPGYFCGVFKQAMGRPPHQYLIEQRVERAQALLCDSDLSLTDVALTVGFSSQSHMNDHFRRLLGVTPACYRMGIAGSASGATSDCDRNDQPAQHSMDEREQLCPADMSGMSDPLHWPAA